MACPARSSPNLLHITLRYNASKAFRDVCIIAFAQFAIKLLLQENQAGRNQSAALDVPLHRPKDEPCPSPHTRQAHTFIRPDSSGKMVALGMSFKEETMRLDQMPYHSAPTLAVLPFRQFHIGWSWHLRALKLFPDSHLARKRYFLITATDMPEQQCSQPTQRP